MIMGMNTKHHGVLKGIPSFQLSSYLIHRYKISVLISSSPNIFFSNSINPSAVFVVCLSLEKGNSLMIIKKKLERESQDMVKR